MVVPSLTGKRVRIIHIRLAEHKRFRLHAVSNPTLSEIRCNTMTGMVRLRLASATTVTAIETPSYLTNTGCNRRV